MGPVEGEITFDLIQKKYLSFDDVSHSHLSTSLQRTLPTKQPGGSMQRCKSEQGENTHSGDYQHNAW